MSQSRLTSLIEATVNVVVGYAVAVATQIVVFPLFGLQASLGQNLGIGAAFTVVSLVRSYVIRRAFERWRTSQRTCDQPTEDAMAKSAFAVRRRFGAVCYAISSPSNSSHRTMRTKAEAKAVDSIAVTSSRAGRPHNGER